MNIIRNDKLIRRNGRIAQFALIGGLGVLAVGMYISFTRPMDFNLSLAALILGFIASQIGIYYSNRWGRHPRPDEMINAALKGLDNKFTLYHYVTPASHVLVGPTGLWIFSPHNQRGTITYSKGRWRQHGGGRMYWYLKLFAQEGLGRPDLEMMAEAEGLERFMKKNLPEEKVPEVQVAMVMTHDDAQIDIPETETPPADTVHLSKLKELVRRSHGKSLSLDRIRQLNDLFEPADSKSVKKVKED